MFDTISVPRAGGGLVSKIQVTVYMNVSSGRPTGSSASEGYNVSTGRPTGSSASEGYNVSTGRPTGSSASEGYDVSTERPTGTFHFMYNFFLFVCFYFYLKYTPH